APQTGAPQTGPPLTKESVPPPCPVPRTPPRSLPRPRTTERTPGKGGPTDVRSQWRGPLRRRAAGHRGRAAHDRPARTARPRRTRTVVPGTGGPGPPQTEDHRPVGQRRPAHDRPRRAARRRLQRLRLQLPRTPRRTARPRPPLLLALRHRGRTQGVPAVGHRLRPALPRHVRLRDR